MFRETEKAHMTESTVIFALLWWIATKLPLFPRYASVCVCVCMYICVCINIYIYSYIYFYIYIYIYSAYYSVFLENADRYRLFGN